MATSNLITKSLGTTQLSSGSGSPDHVAPTGSLYTDTLTGKTYVSADGTSTGWELLQAPAFGEIFLNTNTTVTTITANNWIATTGLPGWTLSDSNGFTGTSSLVVGANKGGKYLVVAGGSLLFNAALATYDLGISINGGNPAAGNFQSSTVEAAGYNRFIGVNTYIDLVPTDRVSIALRSTTSTNIILRHATLVVTKVF